MNTTNTTTNSLADVRTAADLFQFQTTTHLTPTHIMGIILIGLMAIMILWVLWSLMSTPRTYRSSHSGRR